MISIRLAGKRLRYSPHHLMLWYHTVHHKEDALLIHKLSAGPSSHDYSVVIPLRSLQFFLGTLGRAIYQACQHQNHQGKTVDTWPTLGPVPCQRALDWKIPLTTPHTSSNWSLVVDTLRRECLVHVPNKDFMKGLTWVQKVLCTKCSTEKLTIITLMRSYDPVYRTQGFLATLKALG